MRRAHPPRLPAVPRPRLSRLLLIPVVLVGLGAVSCDEQDSQVALGSAARSTVAEVVDAPGTVTARAAATVSASADGTLARLRVGPGDQVKAGQVLAVIDSPAARRRLDQAKQARDAANRAGAGIGGVGDLGGAQRATDRAAAREFAAARKAAEKITDERLRAALLAQVDAAQRQYRVAARAAGEAVEAVRRGVAGLNAAVRAMSAAQRLQAQQAYDLAKATVDELTLRAPIDGVVQLGGTGTGSAGSADALAGLLESGGLPDLAGAGLPGAPAAPPAGVDGAVPVGAPVTAGTPILTVVDLSELGLVAEVDETDVLLVTPGVTGSVELDAATGAAYPARVRSVDVLPTPATRGGVSYRVRLSLDPGAYQDGRPAPAPRPGMSAVVSLRVREATDAVTVPAAAVFSSDGRDTVWVVRDGRAEPVSVQVGVQGQELVQIVSGVRAGEELVVSGTDQVETGQRLR
nr:biotin/lipoyl-binding protein [Micromonospora sp. DSM 115978]